MYKMGNKDVRKMHELCFLLNTRELAKYFPYIVALPMYKRIPQDKEHVN